jgi:hypothetical protein
MAKEYRQESAPTLKVPDLFSSQIHPQNREPGRLSPLPRLLQESLMKGFPIADR